MCFWYCFGTVLAIDDFYDDVLFLMILIIKSFFISFQGLIIKSTFLQQDPVKLIFVLGLMI